MPKRKAVAMKKSSMGALKPSKSKGSFQMSKGKC